MADYGNGGALVNASTQYVNAYTGESQAFDDTNTLSPQMKEWVETEGLKNFHSKKYFAQFGKIQRLPQRHGVSMELRKINKFRDVQRLIEGVIPKGLKIGYSSKHARIWEYGDYVALSRFLERHAIDDVSADSIFELMNAAANTKDKVVRNEMMAGTNVFYGANAQGVQAQDRTQLTNAHIMTSELVARVATELVKNGAEKIDGARGICITHPYVTHDLRMKDEGKAAWIEAHKYAEPQNIYTGETGMMHGIRFIESDNAVVFTGEDGGAEGASVFTSLFFGKDAYAVLQPEGGEVELILKGPKEAGGPLNQFGTAGVWFETGAKILYDEFLFRVETGSSLGDSMQDVTYDDDYLYDEAVDATTPDVDDTIPDDDDTTTDEDDETGDATTQE